MGVIVGIGQHDLFAGHALVVDDDRRFQVDSRLQRILRNHRNNQLDNVFFTLDLQAAQVLERESADIGTKDQMRINDGERNVLVVKRLQPFERQDFFVLDEGRKLGSHLSFF